MGIVQAMQYDEWDMGYGMDEKHVGSRGKTKTKLPPIESSAMPASPCSPSTTTSRSDLVDVFNILLLLSTLFYV
jgi:hypothetical protein